MPYFLIGMPLIIIFAAGLGWFPTSGMLTPGATYGGPSTSLADLGPHLVLPLATVSLGLIGGYSILMRSSIIETLSEDYVTTARAKGLTRRPVLRSHALPNALLPDGHAHRDQPRLRRRRRDHGRGRLQLAGPGDAHGRGARRRATTRSCRGSSCSSAVSVVLANFAADIVYGYLDPRVRT